MTSSPWPRVYAALVVQLPTLPDWATVTVLDGPPVTGEVPDTFATVGFALDEDSAGGYEQVTEGVPWPLVGERGTVRCELVAAEGGVDVQAVRERAFARLDAVDEFLREDQTLGGILREGSTMTLTVDVLPAQTTAGAAVRLPFTVNYYTTS